MDGLNLFKAIILGIVEGLTEFLPISSTGHLILASQVLEATGEKVKMFEIFIQLGAILAVVWFYQKKIFSIILRLPQDREARQFSLAIITAFLPAALVGLATHKFIKAYLFGPLTVSIALIVGGLFILLIERKKQSNRVSEIEKTPLKTALGIGLAQIVSLVPGISRSGATIMGGLLSGLTRKTATEFSFFLALPTMIAATIFDLYKNLPLLTYTDAKIFLVGFIFSFASALLVIRWLLAFISHHDFKPFAYYRIIFGSLLLLIYFFLLK